MRYQIDPTKVDLKERKRMVFKDFMGVDTLSPVYSISNKRASKMCNFISRDGENHKRYGWKKYLQFDGAINGVFRFTINNTKFNVVYAGTTFWIKRTNTDARYHKMSNCDWIDWRWGNSQTGFVDRECKCYIQNDRAYFIGMGDFVVFAWDSSIQKYRCATILNDKDTYIPTTTTNISCRETDYDVNDNRITYGQRQTFEDVNILTAYRRNEIIGSQVGGAAGNPRTYRLDGENVLVDVGLIIDGYDFNTSTGQTTQISLKTTGNANLLYEKLQTGDSLSFEDIMVNDVPSLYIENGTTLPLPSGFGEENAVSLCKAEYVINNVVLYGIDIQYYMTQSNANTIGTRHNRYGYIRIKKYDYRGDSDAIIYKDNIAIGRSENTLDNDPIRLVCDYQILGIDMPYQIPIIEALNGVDWYSNKDEIFFRDIFNDANGTSYYTYLSYKSVGVPLVSNSDNNDTTIYGYFFPNRSILQLGTTNTTLYARSIAGESNIKVLFVNLDYDETNGFFATAQKVIKSSLSVAFGIGGNALALFVSGYEPKPHMDWWSKELDYTYFPSGNECANGTSNSKVMGYQALGDSSLAIFKEYSKQEPSVYIRSGTDTNLIQGDDGTLSVQVGGYFTSGKYMSKGVIAPKSIAVLQSDPMVLTQDGVCALTIDANTSSISNRVFRERSRLIDNIIKNHNGKENAVAYVYDGKYFLCIGSDVYIADSRYTFSIKGDMTDTFNYEWWIWDNCPMSYIFENEDGDLCFGTTDGKICKFYKGFEDVDYIGYDVKSFSVSTYSEGMALPTHFSPQIYVDMDGDTYTENILDEYDEEGKEFYLKSNEPIYVQIPLNQYTAAYYDGRKVHKIVSNAVDSTEYELVAYNVWDETDNIVPETMVFNWKLRAEDGTETDVGNNIIVTDARDVRFKVHKQNAGVSLVGSYYYQPIDSSLYDAIVEDANDTKWKNVAWGNWYDYAVVYPTRQIEIVVEETIKNVAAYWYTPALDFGTNDYEKTMLAVTIATERYTNGQLEFGWETKTTSSDLTSKGMDTFDFNEINFNKIALDTGWNTSYTKFLKSNFNFIMFRFMSNNNIDCCVHQFTIGYKINRRNRGVK